MAKPKAKVEVQKSAEQIAAEKAHAEAQVQADNDEIARKAAELKAADAKAMEEQDAKEQSAKAKKQAKTDKTVNDKAAEAAAKIMKTPLSVEEKVELANLEARANNGAHMPQATEMLRLGKLRKRAKLIEE